MLNFNPQNWKLNFSSKPVHGAKYETDHSKVARTTASLRDEGLDSLLLSPQDPLHRQEDVHGASGSAALCLKSLGPLFSKVIPSSGFYFSVICESFGGNCQVNYQSPRWALADWPIHCASDHMIWVGSQCSVVSKPSHLFPVNPGFKQWPPHFCVLVHIATRVSKAILATYLYF